MSRNKLECSFQIVTDKAFAYIVLILIEKHEFNEYYLIVIHQ